MSLSSNHAYVIERATVLDEGVSRAVSITSRASNDYEQRKLDRRCTRCGVELPDDTEHQLCDEHLEAQRGYDRKSKSKIRAERRAAGQCADCGNDSETYRCAACLVRQNRIPATGVQIGVDKASRIAARLIPWENSPQNAGRLRLRGGEKGRRSIHEENRADFDLVEKEIVNARKAEAYLHTPAIAEAPRIQREAAWLEAKDKAALAVRYLVGIIKRGPGKHPLLNQIVDSDEDEET